MMFRLLRRLSLGGSRFVPIGRTTLAATHCPIAFELQADKETDNDASRVFSIAFASGRSGFTIIELLVAIAVITALAAIAVPSLRDYRYKALIAQAKSDIKDLDVLITRYYADNMTFPTVLPTSAKPACSIPGKSRIATYG